MARSAEYPDLPFVEPRSWNVGRANGQPSVIVIHSTDGSEGLRSAEDGAAYDARRTDGTSTHYFHDQDSTIQCVYTYDRANHARATGNRIGIAHELCGMGGQTAAQWHDAASIGTLLQAAKQCARDAKKYGIPRRRLTPAQLRNGEKGFAGHVDITNAFAESTHTDPGPGFPWTEFLAMVENEMEISPLNANDQNQIRAIVDDVIDAKLADIRGAVWNATENINVSGTGPANNQRTGSILRYTSAEHHSIQDGVDAAGQTIGQLQQDVITLTGRLAAQDAKLDAILARLPQ